MSGSVLVPAIRCAGRLPVPDLHIDVSMTTLAYTFQDHGALGDSTPNAVQVWGAQRADGLWEGWLRFVADDGRSVLCTGRETVQSSLEALRYWATGLEPVYLEGALTRANIVTPPDNAEAAADPDAA